MTAPRVTKDIAKKRLTIEKEFQADISRVWSAWTTPEKLARWWGPKNWPATGHSFDFRVGGHWHFCLTGPEGVKHWGLLEYTRIDPMKVLHVEDYISDAAGTKSEDRHTSRWEVVFRKVSGTVTLVTTKLIFATEKGLERVLEMGFEDGYTSALDNLNQLLVGRTEPRTATSRDGTSIAYEKLGSGPAIILVGGAMVTRTLPAHTELAAVLSGKNTVINYDRRGRGDSGDTAPYSVEKEIEDLQTMIDVAGGEAAVYGLSSGAILALRAASAGLRITKLVLFEPPFIVDPNDRKPPADSLEKVTRMISQGRRSAAATYFMTKIFGMPAFLPLLMRLTPFWKAILAVANTLPYDLTITGDYTIPQTASSVKTPTLVLHGDHTQPLLIHAAQALARTLPLAALVVLPGENHQVATADLGPVVSEFLERGMIGTATAATALSPP